MDTPITRWRDGFLQRPRKEDAKPGRTTCLRCGTVFQSWDIRANRRCPQCRYAVDSESNEGGVF